MTTQQARQCAALPLDRLHPDPYGVRKDEPSEEADRQLKASIAAGGLIQSLTVSEWSDEDYGNVAEDEDPMPRPQYWVEAGGRRLGAIQALYHEGLWDRLKPVPCIIRHPEEEISTAAISLAENIVREEMTKADEIQAFATLLDEGATEDAIAAEFGYSRRTVRQRAQLARVHPDLLRSFRRGNITLGGLAQYAAIDDPVRQMDLHRRVLKRKKDNHSWQFQKGPVRAQELRVLKGQDGQIKATDYRVLWVGLDVYKQAGGTVEVDLFSNVDDDHVYLTDPDTLESLVVAKLEEWAVEQGLDERWSWVHCSSSFTNEARQALSKAIPLEKADRTEKEEYDLETLTERKNDLYDAKDFEGAKEVEREIAELGWQIQARDVWPEDVMAKGGCVVYLNNDGYPMLEEGFYRAGDAPEDAGDEDQADAGATKPPPDGRKPAKKLKTPHGLSQAVLHAMRTYRTTVVMANLTRAWAVRLLTFQLAMRCFGGIYSLGVLLLIEQDGRLVNREGSPYTGPEHEPLGERIDALPLEWTKADRPWDAFLTLSEKEHDELLTVSVAVLMRGQLFTDSMKSTSVAPRPEFEHVAGSLGIDWTAHRPIEELDLFSSMRKSELVKIGGELLGKEWAGRASPSSRRANWSRS